MIISNASVSPSPSSSTNSILSNATAPFVNNGNKASVDSQVSSIVSLSAQGQSLSQGINQIQASNTQSTTSATRLDTAATENVESSNKETSEAPGVQFLESESKGGRINVIA